MKTWSRFFLVCMLLSLLLALPGNYTGSQANPVTQENAAQQKAETMLSKLTPEEKVGQLFLVTMSGTSFDENSQIYDLISQQHIGGVILSRANDNFSWGEELINPGEPTHR